MRVFLKKLGSQLVIRIESWFVRVGEANRPIENDYDVYPDGRLFIDQGYHVEEERPRCDDHL